MGLHEKLPEKGRVWLVRAEGVNFASTVLDTEDLSITRGASLALLQIGTLIRDVAKGLPSLAEQNELFSGASQCLIELTFSTPVEGVDSLLRDAVEQKLSKLRAADRQAAEASKTEAPFQHLSLMVDAAPLDNEAQRKAAVQRVEARNRAGQMRRWSLPPIGPAGPVNRLDCFDLVRPAPLDMKIPEGKIGFVSPLSPVRNSGKGTDTVAVSASTRARRAYGAAQRKAFYEKELSGGSEASDASKASVPTQLKAAGLGEKTTFTSSLQDIITDAPERDGNRIPLPVSVSSKVAIIYADGNQFGTIREKAGLEAFSQKLKAYRQAFLRQLLGFYAQGRKGKHHEAFVRDIEQADELRLETLLWGGDEFIFAVPAWLALDVVKLFLEASAGWKIEGLPLTHSMGVVIANAKTPVRLMQHRAKEIADLAKDAGLRDRSSVTFEVFESLTPPDLTINGTRRSLYGARDSKELEQLALELALDGSRFGDALKQMKQLKKDGTDGEGFPRSQLYACLREAQTGEGLISARAARTVEDHLTAYIERFGAANGWKLDDLILPACAGSPNRALAAALITQLWDYAALGFGAQAASTAEI